MNWYKISQYKIEEFQPTSIPAMPVAATPIRDSGEIIDPLPLTPNIAPIKLSFENIHIDYAYGQNDYQLWATLQDTKEKVGAIQYAEYQGTIYIQNILVKPSYRRMGIGTALVKELEKINLSEFKNNPIKWGMMTDEGYALKKSLKN